MPFDGKEASWTIRRRTWWHRLSAEEKADLRVLRLALKDVRKPHNWIKGNYGKSGEPRCTVGHVRTHAGSYDAEHIVEAYLAPTLTRDPTPYAGPARVVRWNDARERKQEEVVALFQRAIERVKTKALELAD